MVTVEHNSKLMRIRAAIVSMLLLAACSCVAQKQRDPNFPFGPDPFFGFYPQTPQCPVLVILPSDIVPGSVSKIRLYNGAVTNLFALRWTYTQEGAERHLAFTEFYHDKKVQFEMGSYLSPPGIVGLTGGPGDTNYLEWREGWLKHRTETHIARSESEQAAIYNFLTGKE